MANGAMYTNRDGTQWEVLHDAKLEALRDIIDSREGQPVIVAYQFKSDLARLRAALPQAVHLNDTTDERWNAGEHEVLLLNPASAGHGLNLQHGSDSMVFFGAPWSYDQYEQCLARIAGGLRRTRPTFIYRILTEGTVDLDVRQSLASHRSLQDILKAKFNRRAA